MKNRPTPWQDVKNGALWPIIPIGLIGGVLLGALYPIPSTTHWPFLMIVAAIMIGLMPFLPWRVRAIWVFVVLVVAGAGRLGLSYALNDTELLSYRYFGSIEGRIVDIDQSHSGKLRLTLDDVWLDGEPLRGRARVALHGPYNDENVQAGVRLQTTGHLSPPSGPAEPGGYDFRKRAWLEGIAAVGYTRNPTIFSQPSGYDFRAWVLNARRLQSDVLREQLGDRIGGFAAAIYVGDKSEIDTEVVDDMRNSNLAHLLAISGMHMGTVCALFYFISRRFWGYIPAFRNNQVALRLGILGAVVGTTTYFLFSGMAYSAMRAYMMSMLVFFAIALGRKAFSLRSIGAVLSAILVADPNAIYDIGFQMSFVATIALVVAFDAVPIYYLPLRTPIRWVLILAFTSFVAGLATMPFAAYHFNQIPKFGLIANMLAVPAMSFLVLPLLILWTFLRPFGMGDWVLMLVNLGIEWIVDVAHWVSNFDAAVWRLGSANWYAMALILIGGACFVIGRSRALPLACALVVAGLVLWPQKERPYLLIAETAKFFAVEIEGQRWFSRATGHSFLAEIWAKRVGQEFDQAKYALPIENDWAEVPLKAGWRLIFTTTKSGAEKIEDFCDERTILVAAQAERPRKGNCVFYNEKNLAQMGGVAINLDAERISATPFIDEKKTPWND